MPCRSDPRNDLCTRRWERERVTVGGQMGAESKVETILRREARRQEGRVFHLVSPNDLGRGRTPVVGMGHY